MLDLQTIIDCMTFQDDQDRQNTILYGVNEEFMTMKE